jgi:hypothetical protein
MSKDARNTPAGRVKPEGWPLKDVWEKYEDIAMHFNDLLIRLRTQALAAVAAISTLVTIFGKTGADPKLSWELAALVFSLLAVFWIAILVIDFCYNNRLLIGAVAAIRLLPPGHSPRVLTGHIDFLQVRNGAVHILDYKPDARTNKPIAQLTLYALALTRLAGLRLFDIKCAWFNEEQYCEFFPRTLLARQN